MPLLTYNAKQNRKGVSFKVFHGQPRKLIKNAFITRNQREMMTVFMREPWCCEVKD